MKKTLTMFLVSVFVLLTSAFNQPDAGNYFENGLNSLNQKDYLKAISDFTNSISLNPNNAEAYYYRAYSKELLGNKMGFFSSELCSDYVQAMLLGKKEASTKLKDLCMGECYNMETAFIEPEIVYCADLSSRILTDLPLNATFVNVVKINMFNNKLATLSSKWASMEQLIDLDLSSNRISLLPPIIGKMNKLRELNLNKNMIPSLPIEFGNLIELRTLTIRQNNLTELPKEFCNLKNLETLDLAMNLLTVLPSEIGQLKKLKSLNLVGNEIPVKEQQRIKTLLPNTKITFE
jgi:Leucine-rich repeat (LRR) protein